MPRKTFSQELQEIKDEMRLLTSMVEQALTDRVEVLKNNDLDYLRSQGLDLPRILSQIRPMAEKGVDMLHRAMTAFVDENELAAPALLREDDVIDECYRELYNGVINNVLGDSRNIERTNYIIWAAHNLERLGDRVTNICERVIYIVTGERVLFDSLPKETRLSVGEL